MQNLRVAQATGKELTRIVCAEAAGRLPFDSGEAEIRYLEADNVRQGDSVRREVIWMLSEIGGRNAIKPIARLIANKELREDARMALERIPNKQVLQALRYRFKKAPGDFKPNMAQSLRKRGVDVDGYPCQKLVPKKKTDLKPL